MQLRNVEVSGYNIECIRFFHRFGKPEESVHVFLRVKNLYAAELRILKVELTLMIPALETIRNVNAVRTSAGIVSLQKLVTR